MKIVSAIVPIITFLFASVAHAGTYTGTIRTVHVNMQTQLVHVQFEGSPIFSEAGCSAPWTANSFADAPFKDYVFPILLKAKETGKLIMIWTSSCEGSYPKIYAIDWIPRAL